MRKVLFRFIYDDYWGWQPVENELLIGIGWLLAMWCVIAATAMAITWKMTKDKTQVRNASVIWIIIPLGIIAARWMKLPFTETGIPVFGYGFMMFVGFSTATLLAARRVTTLGLPSDIIWDMMMWLLIPGLIGARVIYLSQNWQNVMAGKQGLEQLTALVALWDGGIVFYGSIIGGVIGLFAYCRVRKLDPIAMCDVIAPSLFIGSGFGRIGCFLYGCCFGHACSLPWAVQFPRDSLTFERLVQRGTVSPEAMQTIPLHPTQLYSSAASFLLAGLLAWVFRHRRFDGQVIALAWILYPVNRYVLEVFRNDEPARLGTGQTFSQLMSLALVLSGVAAFFWFSRRGKITRVSSKQYAAPEKPLQPGRV